MLVLAVAGIIFANLLWRLFCEAWILLFSMHEILSSIERKLEDRDTSSQTEEIHSEGSGRALLVGTLIGLLVIAGIAMIAGYSGYLGPNSQQNATPSPSPAPSPSASSPMPINYFTPAATPTVRVESSPSPTPRELSAPYNPSSQATDSPALTRKTTPNDERLSTPSPSP